MLLEQRLFLRLGLRTALTVALCSGNRNLSIVLALTGGLADDRLLTFLAVAQLPIFVMPSLLRPLYRRILVLAVCIGWVIFEVFQQQPFWLAIAVAATTFAVYEFFLRGTYRHKPPRA